MCIIIVDARQWGALVGAKKVSGILIAPKNKRKNQIVYQWAKKQ